MVGSSRRRTLRRRMQRANALAGGEGKPPPKQQPVVINIADRLPPELLAKIHGYLHDTNLVKRLAFASICGAPCQRILKQEAPCLILGGGADVSDAAKASVFSLADRRAATVRASDPAMRGHLVLGSSGGWLFTADEKGALRMANPVTGAQADLPPITTGTIPFIEVAGGSPARRFCIDMNAFRQIRFAGAEPPSPATEDNNDGEWGPILPRTYTLTSWQMCQSFYRKVVLSADSSQTAMLILDRIFGSPAFATAEDATWRLAPSHHGGVEDAIHHRGKFYSITHTGVVESWDLDVHTGEFTSTVHAPAMQEEDDGGGRLRRRYLAVGLDGRLMAVTKHTKNVPNPEWTHEMITRVSFKVVVLDEARRRWEEVEEIGGAAVFVGVNASVSVAAMEHRGIRPNCVYFTEDDVAQARLWHEEEEHRSYYSYREPKDGELRNVGVYSLKRGKVDKINHPTSWPPPVWFTPSLP